MKENVVSNEIVHENTKSAKPTRVVVDENQSITLSKIQTDTRPRIIPPHKRRYN